MRTYEIKIEHSELCYFYIGVAHSKTKHYRIVKFGITDRLEARANEHRRHKYSPDEYSLNDFEYIQTIKLKRSTAETLETTVRNFLKGLEQEDEIFIRNERYVITHDEPIEFKISVTDKKVYTIVIPT